MHYGLEKRPEATRLHAAAAEFLMRVDTLAWDNAVAETYGQMRNQLERNGRVLGSLDMLIAAHALHTGSVLVTNDQAFAAIPGLGIEDWTGA
ncbi:PIN domain-containing protein [Pollutimonas sp. M17]|uniref:PIN domain-containing protein n=1 Tax=Pollutimonas sp. M17 TaxID=2962065 RepID=UPI0021F3DEB5|nr:PIN domain-containing protein [Pollutimonas sp. M17]UYO93955.1 PIN domain-containing protein [Pollutimonas sp. M17]